MINDKYKVYKILLYINKRWTPLWMTKIFRFSQEKNWSEHYTWESGRPICQDRVGSIRENPTVHSALHYLVNLLFSLAASFRFRNRPSNSGHRSSFLVFWRAVFVHFRFRFDLSQIFFLHLSRFLDTMTFSEDEDETLAQFLESEVLSEVSDKVLWLFMVLNFISCVNHRLGFWFGGSPRKCLFCSGSIGNCSSRV